MTERDVVLRERAAFEAGARFHYEQECSRTRGLPMSYSHNITYTVVSDEAKRRYAVKIIRTRVVRDPQRTNYGPASGHTGKLYWSVKDGQLHAVNRDGQIIPAWEDDQRRDSWPTPNRVAMWADLLANPTEEVEDVGA